MIYKVFIFLAFFPPGKSNHCYHPLKTEMPVFWAGLETSQGSVTIPGISTHPRGGLSELLLHMHLVCLESHPAASPCLLGATPAALGV